MKTCLVSLTCVALASLGCRSGKAPGADLIAAHAMAAERTSTATSRGPVWDEPGVRRFVDFYRVYSADAIRAGVRDLYAADAYFGDPYKAVNGIDAIEAYFLRMAEPVHLCTFEVTGAERAGSEYFFVWQMTLEIKQAKGKPIRALGMSHVRFDEAGKVVFQQDYWDTSLLLDRIPVVGAFTRAVKRRLD